MMIKHTGFFYKKLCIAGQRSNVKLVNKYGALKKSKMSSMGGNGSCTQKEFESFEVFD